MCRHIGIKAKCHGCQSTRSQRLNSILNVWRRQADMGQFNLPSGASSEQHNQSYGMALGSADAIAASTSPAQPASEELFTDAEQQHDETEELFGTAPSLFLLLLCGRACVCVCVQICLLLQAVRQWHKTVGQCNQS